MRSRNVAAVAAALQLIGAGAPAAQPYVITKPDWLAKPDAATLARVYPPLTAQLGIGGLVIMECGVQASGRLEDCRVVREAPTGLGLGVAALHMADAFQMQPQSVGGRPTDRGVVKIPIRFAPSPSLQYPDLPPPPSAHALALARELQSLRGDTIAAAQAKIDPIIRKLEDVPRTDVSPEIQQAMASGLRESAPRRIAEGVALRADLYATAITEDQLSKIVDFFRSDAGRAFSLNNDDTRSMGTMIEQEYRRLSAAESHAAYCAIHTCTSDAAAIVVVERKAASGATPTWIEKPSEHQIDEARPQFARSLSVGGAARLTCAVTDLGALSACEVAAETPTGLGFGAAAASLRGYYRLDPTSLDRHAVSGTVDLVVRFPAPDPDPGQPFEGVPPRSASAMALAREIVAAEDVRQLVGSAWIDYSRTARGPLRGQTESEWTAAMQDIATGANKAKTRTDELKAAYLTTHMTDTQLRTALSFVTGPAGQAWRSKLGEFAVKEDRINRAQNDLTWRDVGLAVCRVLRCTETSTLPPAQSSTDNAAPSTAKP